MNNIVNIEKKSVLLSMANRYGMEPDAFKNTIIKTCMPSKTSVTQEQFTLFLLVAKEHDLNPTTGEIFAFETQYGGIKVVVSIDGWMKLINNHPDFDGIEFIDNKNNGGEVQSIDCRIYRKSRAHPTVVTEYMNECRRVTDPWKKWPVRMLRHKAAIQCARYAFGFAGIIDQDEAERHRESSLRNMKLVPPSPEQVEDISQNIEDQDKEFDRAYERFEQGRMKELSLEYENNKEEE